MGEAPGRQRLPPPCPRAKDPCEVMRTHRGVCGQGGGGGGSKKQRDCERNQGSFASTGQLATTFWLVGLRHKGSAGMCGPRVARVSEPSSSQRVNKQALAKGVLRTQYSDQSRVALKQCKQRDGGSRLFSSVVNALLQPANKRADGDAGPMTSADDSAGAARSQRAAPACFFSDPFSTCQPFHSSQQRTGVGGRRQQPESTSTPGQGRPLPDIGSLPTCAAWCRRVLTPPDRPTHGRSIVMVVGVKLQYLRFRRVHVNEAMQWDR